MVRRSFETWEGIDMCSHRPACPDAQDRDCYRAHVVSDHTEQGWCRLCNGIILFDDGHYLTRDGRDALVSVST